MKRFILPLTLFLCAGASAPLSAQSDVWREYQTAAFNKRYYQELSRQDTVRFQKIMQTYAHAAGTHSCVLAAMNLLSLVEEAQTAQAADGPFYVFLGEEHDNPTAAALIEYLTAFYRQKHPKSKILYATEFKTGDGTVRPGAEKGDVLPLEPVKAVIRAQNDLAVQIGDEAVRVVSADEARTLPQSQLNALFKETVQENSVSPWGMQARNMRWLRLLKTHEKNYDVIFVHAGAGHHDKTFPNSLPNMLGAKRSLGLIFFSRDENRFREMLGKEFKSAKKIQSYCVEHFDEMAVATEDPENIFTCEFARSMFYPWKERPGEISYYRLRQDAPEKAKRQFGFDVWVLSPAPRK